MVLNPFRRKPVTPRQEILGRLSLLSDLTPAELTIVDGLLHERTYLTDEVIFDEGEEGQAIYFILAGEVLICRQGEPETGRLAVLGPGSFFGDVALLDDSPRTAQARAASILQLVVFFRADFLGLVETHGRIASKISLQLARNMGRRLRAAALGALVTHQHL